MGGWFQVVLCIWVALWTSATSLRCLPKDPGLKRHFYFNGKNLPLTIETSDRVSHQLASHILKILLQEVLGYEKVEIKHHYNSMNASDILNRLAGCHSSGLTIREQLNMTSKYACIQQPGTVVPETMVNLEVWMPAGFNMEPWVNSGYISDAGPLGPSGRFGWYMPTNMVERHWYDSQDIIDHWRALKTQNLAEEFSLSDKLDLVKGLLTKQSSFSESRICNKEYCHDGIYKNRQQCGSKHNRCAVLLSSYPELDNDILKEQIQNLGLNIQVAWIGSHLHNFINDRTSRYLPSLFFNWMPNTLTAMGNYTRVKFPYCKTSQGLPVNCDFEINQLSKAMWIRMQTHTPEAYRLIMNMGFSQQQYEELLRLYVSKSPSQLSQVNDSSFEATACDWIKENTHVWKSWVPKNLSNKTKIYLGGMFPLSGPYWRQPGIVPGVQMALELINANSSILPHYELVLLIADTECKSDLALKQFMYYLVNDSHPIAGILGPGCSSTAEPIAGVSKHFNTVIVSYSAEQLQLGNRQQYPLFFRTIPQMSQFGLVYLDVFEKFNWHQVALLAEDAQEFPAHHGYLQDLFFNKGISVVFNRKTPKQVPPEEARKYVEDIKAKNVRIIILTMFETSGRAVVCEAYKQGMTADKGYQWFLPAWFTVEWWNTTFFNSKQIRDQTQSQEIPCTPAQMKQAVDGYMSLSYAFFGAHDNKIIGDITMNQWRMAYEKRLRLFKIPESSYASFAYDAVWVFALGLHKLLTSDPTALESLHTSRTTERYMHYLNNTQFDGVSGPIKFHGADRVGIIDILQFHKNRSELIGQYHPSRNVTQRLELNQIRWPSGSMPQDGSIIEIVEKCSIEAFRVLLDVNCDTSIVIANIMGVSIFFIIMIICLILVKRRYDAKVRATRERMEELGLITEDTGWLSLDQWELPRDHVVLNRKLGEGAFGTVYGGEALIEENWVAVAVKTLKIGSNPEEKLDFLSEAEMMKRFDHENIVKLLGVCTRGEPAYAVMEFMLHGDLKTYLLARRQLVGQASKEAEDIMPERLTKMALDIAYGLKYLTELKYVHRDLACRNCLVHASKTVKIGDFGMTRPMYDSDYYRFNKRGMLPVRWMAPESLADGVFSPASDIWSYGVLLYEIMTFGSFPYQGYSNKQVLEHVKCGNTIGLPGHCSEELNWLLKACWAYDRDRRPVVDELIEIFQHHETIVKPCLDTPTSAVVMEGTGSLEMALPTRSSHHMLRSVLRNSYGNEHQPLKQTNSNSEGEVKGYIRSTPGRIGGMIKSDPFSLMCSPSSINNLEYCQTETLLVRKNSHTQSSNSVMSRQNSINNHTTAQPKIQESVHKEKEMTDHRNSVVSMDCKDNKEKKDTTKNDSLTCPQSPKSLSPTSPIQLKYIMMPASLEEKTTDSDYCSDNSKDYWNHSNGLNTTSVV